MTKVNLEQTKSMVTTLRDITTKDFKEFGVQQIAYIRAIDNGSDTDYSVHSADGEQIGIFESRDAAIVGALQRDLEPVTTH